MRRFKFILVMIFCLLAGSGVMSAQNDWDSVLDRYESITAQCKELRDKAAAGGPVSQKSVTALFGELSRLRNTLQQASGKMTKAQRERFRAIRESYEGGKILRSALRQAQGSAQNDNRVILSEAEGVAKDLSKANGAAKDLSKANGAAKDLNDEPVLRMARVPIEPLPKGKEILRFAQNDTPVILSGAGGAAKDLFGAGGAAKDLSAAPVAYQGFGRQHWNIIALASFGDVVGYGLHASYLSGRWGGYVSLRTNFVSQLYAYDVLSDGTTVRETGFEAKGDQRIGEFSASAGVVRSVTPWLDLYAGAGYGSSTLCWNDIHGAWAKVKDYSGSGLMLDGGALLHVGRLSLLGGVSWLTARPEAGPFKPVFSLGAGISFHGHP